jgi:hypothetical protein
MGEMANQIQGHIEEQRDQLGRNISDLQEKVKHTFDWRTQMQERPMTVLAVAFAGGALLSAVMNGEKVGRYASHAWQMESGPATSRERHKANQSWDKVKASLIGAGVSMVREFFEESIPGFREHYQKTSREQGSDSEAADFRQAPAA